MWTAEFVDGPVAEADVEWHFAGALSKNLWLMPSPRREGEWTVVGIDGAEPDAAHPWPGQVHYALDIEATTHDRPDDWQPGEDEGHVIYRQVDG